METVTFTKVVQIADADGRAIREGSVLREINDGTRGVVTIILRVGDSGPLFGQVGDVLITTGPGCVRGTNRYNQWRHIPHNEQTYEERYLSWLKAPTCTDADSSIPEAEQIACQGIMALLPDDVVNDVYGPWPDRIEDALRYLVQHLSDSVVKKNDRPFNFQLKTPYENTKPNSSR